MSLRLRDIALDQFRGYEHLALERLENLTLFVGANAVGKTNVVEAVQLVTSAESFRKPSWSELVSWGRQWARVEARFEDGARCIEHTMRIADGKRVYEVNGKRKPASALHGTCPAVLFIPDDLQLVKASASMRRDCLDNMAAQLSGSYASLRKEYAQVLKQRNLLLRDEMAHGPLFDSWTESLVVHGARLCSSRHRLFCRLAAHMVRIYGEIVPAEHLDIRYTPSWERTTVEGRQMGDVDSLDECGQEAELTVESAQERLHEAAAHLLAAEQQRKSSLFGPHRDEVTFFIDGRNARLYASQGQQRTLVLVWKLAEVELVNEILDQEPLLLLDDVMSELDGAHRDALTRFMEKSAQTFITTTNLGYFTPELVQRAKVIELPIEGTKCQY